ncbi:uncharacterized protein DI49_1725 [Saccharomyces eubayanus]|uniref:uncharacterized protein n=1 Tax=Saccharomyces eubayanus TaxID=1080349 RepID=UPI0006C596F1|nr:hypothetical protein DI49_1725 [Saccharomyces eubayanus]KOG99279.1 hypothetical protein DI49_1725 [Saccharomyces eubayanus]
MYILRPFAISMYPVDVGCSERAEIVSTIGSVVADNVLGNNRFDDNNVEMDDEERAVNADVYEYTIMLEAFIKILEANKVREFMLKGFLFIDTSNCGLMKRTHFSTVLSTYPTSISNRQAQNLTSFQRGLAALWINFVPLNYSLLTDLESHIANIHRNAFLPDIAHYGCNESRAVQSMECPSELCYCKAKIENLVSKISTTYFCCYALNLTSNKNDDEIGTLEYLLKTFINWWRPELFFWPFPIFLSTSK